MLKWSKMPSHLVLFALMQAQCLLAQSNNSTSTTADMVCAPSIGCIRGQVSAKAGVRISITGNPNSSTPSSALLLPGTYTTRSSAGANSTLLDPFFSSTAVSASTNPGFQLSQSGSSPSTVNSVAASISQSSGLIIYSSTFFAGSTSLLSFNDSFVQNATSSFTPLSFLLSSNIRAVANLPTSGNGMQRVVLWSGSADVSQLPLQLRNGNWEISDIQGTTCSPACASGGVCSLESTCTCAAGFTGASCDQCEPGRFGPQCTSCPSCSDGSTCDEGIAGSGRCISPALEAAADACDCVNGVCAGGTELCTCSPGWGDAAGGKKCSVCQTGFYQDSTGDCVTCAPGCVACAANTGTCSSCAPGLSPSNDNPQQCIAARFLPSNGTTFTSCADGTFLSSAQTCSPCNAACETCRGAGVDQCLSCSSGRGLLQGRCVAVDATTGVCDGSIINSSNALAYIFNNEKKLFPLAAPLVATRRHHQAIVEAAYSAQDASVAYSWSAEDASQAVQLASSLHLQTLQAAQPAPPHVQHAKVPPTSARAVLLVKSQSEAGAHLEQHVHLASSASTTPSLAVHVIQTAQPVPTSLIPAQAAPRRDPS